MTDDSRYVPVALAAKMVGRSVQTIHTWIRRGHVKQKRTASGIMVHIFDVAKHDDLRPRASPSEAGRHPRRTKLRRVE